METDSYSANQRRAINLVWTACGDYQFEPQFLALKADGTPDFYMNCVIVWSASGWVSEMPRRLFAFGRTTRGAPRSTTSRGSRWKTPSMKRSFPSAPCSRSCAAPTPQNFLPRNISSRGRSGWTRTSSSTRSSPPAGDLSLGRSRRCSPRGKRGSPQPSPARARSTRTIWRPPSARRLRNTCNLTARPIKNHRSAFISATAGRRCSPSSCRSRSSAPTS